MRRLWKLLASKLGLGIALIGTAAASVYRQPLRLEPGGFTDEDMLKYRVHRANLFFQQKYGVGLPKLDVSVDKNNLHRVAFSFTATNLNHLKVFNSLLEAYHKYKHLTSSEINLTDRKIKGDTVIYTLKYHTLNTEGTKKDATAYLIGDTKKGTYRLSLEKEGEIGKFELWLLLNTSRECPNLVFDESIGDEEDGETESPNPNHKTFALLSSVGCYVLEPHNNSFSAKKTFDHDSVKAKVSQVLKVQPKTKGEAKTVAFVGPEGNGKTFVGKVLAHDMNTTYIEVPLNVLLKKSETELQSILYSTRKLEKAVVLVDNMEAIESIKDEWTKKEVLRFVEDLKKNENHTLILSTNGPNMERNLAEQVIQFGTPEIKTRQEIFAKFASHLSNDQRKFLSRLTNGMSVKDIIDLCRKVKVYWREHYMGKGEEMFNPPIKIYVRFIPNKGKI